MPIPNTRSFNGDIYETKKQNHFDLFVFSFFLPVYFRAGKTIRKLHGKHLAEQFA